ncbi:uncharacterized protein LOC129585310 [Paramacrobiotus metropolitanus]|uniref:uncharacterized protein LOC129585310 n=1 Tax=Paramacrobiotus metropolitanus TaxID=2943436 RepID=UPI0024464B11|nr:uncharacterized protein LOC129585310 [Paramacrobiotus metropolitanus]
MAPLASRLRRSLSVGAADDEQPIFRRRNIQNNISIPIRGSFRHRAHIGWQPEHGFVTTNDADDSDLNAFLNDALDVIKGGMQCLDAQPDQLPTVIVTAEKNRQPAESGTHSVQNGSFTLPNQKCDQKNTKQKRFSDFSFLKRFSLSRSTSPNPDSTPVTPSPDATTPTKRKSRNIFRSLSDAALFAVGSGKRKSEEIASEPQMEISSPIPGSFKHVQHVGFGEGLRMATAAER